MKRLSGPSEERMKKVFLAFQINSYPQGPLSIAKAAGITRDQVNYLIRTYPDYWHDKGNGRYSLSGSGELALAALCGQAIKVYSNEDILETVNSMAAHNKQIAEAHLPKHAPEPVLHAVPAELSDRDQIIADLLKRIERLEDAVGIGKRSVTATQPGEFTKGDRLKLNEKIDGQYIYVEPDGRTIAYRDKKIVPVMKINNIWIWYDDLSWDDDKWVQSRAHGLRFYKQKKEAQNGN